MPIPDPFLCTSPQPRGVEEKTPKTKEKKKNRRNSSRMEAASKLGLNPPIAGGGMAVAAGNSTTKASPTGYKGRIHGLG